ncbi:MAG: glycosyltransferase family 4 protein [Elusimicrobia bacterium]|nr:glycosyltransferase family 4 protein [Elusimicrobiota bacterium]
MRIKVLHLITKLEMGGAQGNTIYTFKNLNKEKFYPQIAFGPGGIREKELENENSVFKIKSLRREINFLADIRAFLEIFFLLKKEKPDILHTHSSKAGIIGRFAARAAGIKKIIHTYHGFGFNERQNFLMRNLYIFLEKIASEFCSKIIFVSKSNMEKAKDFKIGNPENYILIRSGVKISEIKKTEKNKEILYSLPLKKSSFYAVSVGNLKPQKNPEDFIKIAEKAEKENLDISFLYIGGGDRLDYFKKETENKKISERCLFLGWDKNPEKYCAAADIFILTSLWEGLPRSLVEALSLGLIPICYDSDGVSDLIKNGENGYLIDQKDFESSYKAIKSLISNPDLFMKLKNEVLKTDLSDFDIDKMVKDQESLYLSVLSESV